MRAIIGIVALLTLGAAAAPAVRAQPAAGQPVPLFVVGDSLSDIGNAAAVADFLLGTSFHPAHTIGLCNPADVYLYQRGCGDILYGHSRVSDGPLAVEHLAAHLGDNLVASFHTVPGRPVVGTNYAVASAKARGDGPEDLSWQLDMLLADHGPRLPHAIYVVMIGGNDAIDALQARFPTVAAGSIEAAAYGPPAEQTVEQIITETAAAIGDATRRLAEAGADCVIVANVPNLATLPAVATAAREAGIDEQTAAAEADSLSTALNERLAVRLSSITAEHPQVTLIPFELNALLSEAQVTAAQAGLNVRDACFDSEGYRSSFAAERHFHAGCAPTGSEPPRFGQFFFWDGIHPTGAAHAMLGDALIEAAARCAAPRTAAAVP